MIGAPEILILFMLFVGLGAFVLWLVFLVEAVRIPDSAWRAADQNKVVYVLLMVFLGLIGTLIYALAARGAVRRGGGS